MKRKYTKSNFLLAAFIGIFLLSGYGWTQGPPQGRGRDARLDPQTAKRMDTIKLVQLVDSLGLSDEQAIKISKIMTEHREATTPLRQNMQTISNSLKAETSKTKPNGKVIAQKVGEYKSVIQKLSKERETYVDKMLKVLNPVQQGKFIVFHEDFPRKFRRNMQKFRNFKGRRSGRGNNNWKGMQQNQPAPPPQ